MIKNLHVKNFAIIDDINLEFKPNMTSLTGQTGAGKSLIIDCISLLLGARADLDMIRYNETKATIDGTFDYKNKKIDELLDKYSIPKTNELEIKREISQRSKILINNTTVTLNQLKEISFYLADIHVQNDTYKLVNPDNYINIIDLFCDKKIDDLSNNYMVDLIDYKEALKEYKDATNKNEEMYDKLDLLKFQYDELSKLDLKENELEDITKEINVLSNYDRIFSNLNLALEKLENIDDLYDAISYLKKIKEYDESYDNFTSVIENAYYSLDDTKKDISKSIKNMDFNKDYLDSLIERENELNRIVKKYKMSVNELINHISKIKKEIDKCENYDEYVSSCYNDLCNKHKKLVESAKKLEDLREKTGKILSVELIKVSKELDLENINFEIQFKYNDVTDPVNSTFYDYGISNVDFLISLNKGEPLKPLSKVASGGELSRIMLGLKTILAEKQNLSLMVFDEIDSGISGVTASHIASKIKEISKTTQVLCITHLPHVASIADNQLYISKYEENNRTYTKVEELDYNSRVKQIAIMISGTKITESALENAKELLKA